MRTTTLLLALAFVSVGCDDPADEVPTARIDESAPTTPNPDNESESSDLGTATPNGLAIDTAASTFEFVGSKVTGSEVGHFGEWSGSIDLQEPAQESSVIIEIQMASVQTQRARLTSHLRTDDFFAVGQYPTARFETVTMAPAGADAEDATHLVTGRLTLRGQTQTITFPVNLEVSDAEVRARASFAIDRQQWGVSYRGMEDDLIRDQVVIRFDVRAPRG